jgi:hypothetical protein
VPQSSSTKTGENDMENECQDEQIDESYELKTLREFEENEAREEWREILYRERGQHFDNYL